MEGLQKTNNRAIFLFQNFKLKQKTDADFYIGIKDISYMKKYRYISAIFFQIYKGGGYKFLTFCLHCWMTKSSQNEVYSKLENCSEASKFAVSIANSSCKNSCIQKVGQHKNGSR